MNILITGVNGLVGKAIAEELFNGNRIIGISRSPDNKTTLPIEYQSINISSINSLKTLSNKHIDIIVHCAASLDLNPLSEELITTNCMGIRNIALLALTSKCKQFIYISGIPIIGKPIQLPISEGHPVHPEIVYHSTKYFGELYLSNVLKELNLVIFRLPSPIGVDIDEKKIVSTIVRKCIINEDITLKGNGGRIQNYIDVKDVANAVNLAIKENISGTYNIASDRSYSNQELAEIAIKLLKSNSKIRYEEIDKQEDNKWIISIEKAKNDFNYVPRISLETSLLEISKRYIL